MKQLPDIDTLSRAFRFEAQTGKLYWRIKASKGECRIGAVAGSLRKDGYVSIKLDGARYFAHRIIWKLIHGTDPIADIDHIDGDRSNNRPANLRAATRTQNSRNMRPRRRLKGAWSNASGWSAMIQVDGARIYLGQFRTEEEAHAAYVAAAQKYFGEFARAA